MLLFKLHLKNVNKKNAFDIISSTEIGIGHKSVTSIHSSTNTFLSPAFPPVSKNNV